MSNDLATSFTCCIQGIDQQAKKLSNLLLLHTLPLQENCPTNIKNKLIELDEYIYHLEQQVEDVENYLNNEETALLLMESLLQKNIEQKLVECKSLLD